MKKNLKSGSNRQENSPIANLRVLIKLSYNCSQPVSPEIWFLFLGQHIELPILEACLMI